MRKQYTSTRSGNTNAARRGLSRSSMGKCLAAATFLSVLIGCNPDEWSTVAVSVRVNNSVRQALVGAEAPDVVSHLVLERNGEVEEYESTAEWFQGELTAQANGPVFGEVWMGQQCHVVDPAGAVLTTYVTRNHERGGRPELPDASDPDVVFRRTDSFVMPCRFGNDAWMQFFIVAELEEDDDDDE